MSGASNSRLLPASIVIGAGLLATGIYLGLRASAPTPASASAAPTFTSPRSTNVGLSAPLESPRSAAPHEAPSSRPPAVELEPRRKAVADAVQADLAAKKRTLTTACWEPSAAQAASLPSAEFRVRVLVDAAGKLVTVGVAGPSDGALGAVAACLEKQLASIALPAPGAEVGVEVKLVLP